MDSLKPSLTHADDLKAVALHESFADLSAIFCLIDFVDASAAILQETGGNLQNKSFLSTFYDDFTRNGIRTGMRSANNNLKTSDIEDSSLIGSLVSLSQGHTPVNP